MWPDMFQMWVQSELRGYFPHNVGPETRFGRTCGPCPANDDKPILTHLFCAKFELFDDLSPEVVRFILGTGPLHPIRESASPSPPQGSIWHRFNIDSTSIS